MIQTNGRNNQMKHDANNIIDNLNQVWAQDLANAKKELAILAEENRLLQEENKSVKKQLKEQSESIAKKDN